MTPMLIAYAAAHVCQVNTTISILISIADMICPELDEELGHRGQ